MNNIDYQNLILEVEKSYEKIYNLAAKNSNKNWSEDVQYVRDQLSVLMKEYRTINKLREQNSYNDLRNDERFINLMINFLENVNEKYTYLENIIGKRIKPVDDHMKIRKSYKSLKKIDENWGKTVKVLVLAASQETVNNKKSLDLINRTFTNFPKDIKFWYIGYDLAENGKNICLGDASKLESYEFRGLDKIKFDIIVDEGLPFGICTIENVLKFIMDRDTYFISTKILNLGVVLTATEILGYVDSMGVYKLKL